jgi:ferredoxin
MDLQDMQGSCSEACPASSDANQITSIKVEDVSDTEAEEDSVPLKYLGIKTEHVVSCMSLLSRFHRYTKYPVFFLISIPLCVQMTPLYCGELILKSPFHTVE